MENMLQVRKYVTGKKLVSLPCKDTNLWLLFRKELKDI